MYSVLITTSVVGLDLGSGGLVKVGLGLVINVEGGDYLKWATPLALINYEDKLVTSVNR